MSGSPIDVLVERLNARPNGRDRWRANCPACEGTNRSALSVGVGESGAVLVKCFRGGCAPEQIAHAIGLELADLFPSKESSAAPATRRRLISANQALELLAFEASVVSVVAEDMVQQRFISDDDLARLRVAAERVAYLRSEVHS